MLSFLLLLLPGSGLGVLISQFPRTLTQRPGETMKITCVQNETSYPYMYWYKQLQGEGPKLIAQSADGFNATYEERYNETKFPITRLNIRISSMSVVDLRTQDSANYFCAASERDRTNTPQYFGEGTRLTVLEDLSKISDPEVAIFPPSKQEIKEKRKATLVCLATNFYPDHIKLVWQVNGVERKEGVRTEESLLDNYKEKYSLTSRLRISHQEWSNPKNTFQCFVEFYGNETKPYNKVINGVADCSVSEESYLRSAMASKSVYVLLIFKSALYGVFVMGLMLRNKQVQ